MWRFQFRIPVLNVAVGIVVARIAALQRTASAEEQKTVDGLDPDRG